MTEAPHSQDPTDGMPTIHNRQSTIHNRMSRRTFFRLATLGGIGVALAVLERQTAPIGAYRYVTWAARGEAQRLAGRPPTVALGKCPAYDGADVLDCLRETWHQAEMPDVTGKRVLVKPNLIDFIEGHPVTTAPAVVGALLDLFEERGAGEVAVGDGPGFRREAWPVVAASGLADILATRKVPFVDLNYDDPKPVPARDGWFLRTREVWLPRHVREADLIVSVPKVKTHHWAGVSLSLKNLFGIVPGARYGWPKNMLHINGLPLSILGLYQMVRPVVSVADGIVGMEGDGPLFGTPVAHGLLAAGADPVAVDATCARLMGIAPAEVDHLYLASWAGLGNTDRIELRGAPVEALQRQYQRAPSL
jgi:uncharacterized protein (DUF362 family)